MSTSETVERSTAAERPDPRRFRSGFLLGKFYPPHAGHDLLIETAAARCERLVVLVAGATAESIPLALRHAWLAERHPDVTVVSVVDDAPIDYDDPDVWQAHMDVFRSVMPADVDVVFSSESYGDELAARLGVTHVCVDPHRSRVPLSATAVREDVAGNWGSLTPAVRAYLAKRVVVCGSESTGTTTIARALAEHYDTEWVPEYGHELSFVKQRQGTLDHWTEDEFVLVAARQRRIEEDAARRGGTVLICDTDAWTTEIWAERYLGYVPEDVAYLASSAVAPALRLLTSPVDVPFEQDGVRDGEHLREWMHERFRERLARQPAPWLELTGTHAERLAQAVAAVDRVLADGWRFAQPLG